MNGSNRVAFCQRAAGNQIGVAERGRILERRSGIQEWKARPAKGNPAVAPANGRGQLEIGSG
jgi:hypothetical protein